MTVKDIRDYLSYDPVTGVFNWIKRPAYCIQVGDIAGRANPRGYQILTFNGRQEYCHRVAFTMMGHTLEDGEYVDHVNKNVSDNRWINLRKATPQQNSHNRIKPVTNSSGFKGVCWDIHKNKWRVYCQHKHYGYFSDLEQAKEKYIQVSKKEYEEFYSDN